MITDIKKLKKIDDILNSEGSILGLYQFNNQLYLGSYMSDKTGVVYYLTTKEILNQYLNSEMSLRQVYIYSEDFIVSSNFRNDSVEYLKQDLADKIQFSNNYYNELSDGLKNPNIKNLVNGT